MNFHTLILLFSAVVFARAKLPSYITKCSISDPKLGDCIKQQMINTLPKVIHGDKNMRIPNLDPFHLTEIEIEATETLTLKLLDIDIKGLDKVKLGNFHVDGKKMTSKVELTFDEIDITATYDIKGQLLILPIQGHGPAKITMKNAKFTFEFDWDVKPNDKGVDYVVLGDSNLHYTTEKSHYHFDNLFNGDKALGDQMNAFIEENSEEVSKDIEPSVSETIKLVVMGIFQSVCSSMPFSDILDP
ncbi:PREDICTED: protein takeout-like [Nicrophorus vespilloides]|uniref:Protein takeout-like n=1 Tax=Nicrophorus vespilloides TaxID=110193 RepID=A0ABM1MHC7_NICVS|nr:PREDICTED: protein takeout-like [Nicrophorus vespilloides]